MDITTRRIVYLDESGDLGWNFGAPYRKNGSSRYLTICAVAVPPDKAYLIKRFVKNLYLSFNWQKGKEMKWGKLPPSYKDKFAKECQKFLNKYIEIKCFAITVYKPKVNSRFWGDANILYNYMTGLLLLKYFVNFDTIHFIPDPRSTKVSSGNCLTDYLQTKLWFELNANTVIQNNPQESSKCQGIQFADMLAGIIQESHQDNKYERKALISRNIITSDLFFPKSPPQPL